MELSWLSSQPLQLHAGEDAASGLRLVGAADPVRRAAVENLIRRRFAEQHQARIWHFMPCLFGLESADGRLHGAVGFRAAQDETLFLERYLDVPIEQAMHARYGVPAARDEIIEIGNLAAQGLGTARLMIVALTAWLAGQGYRWVVFTGTRVLVNSFRRLGLTPLALGAAERARMGDEAPDWGSYYDSQPQVMFGEIAGGHRHLSTLGVLDAATAAVAIPAAQPMERRHALCA